MNKDIFFLLKPRDYSFSRINNRRLVRKIGWISFTDSKTPRYRAGESDLGGHIRLETLKCT